MTAMRCERAAELLSDDLEGTLGGVLAADLAQHLASCPECRALRAAMADLGALLRLPAIAPAEDLAARVARASFAATRPRPLRAPRRAWASAAGPWLGWLGEVPFAVQAVAAALALALTAGLVMAAGSAPEAGRPRLAQRVSAFTAFLLEKKDRAVEDLRLLRVVIATAFEGRLDRVNDRVDDYRRLLERRQKEEQAREHKKTEARRGAAPWAAEAEVGRETTEPAPPAPRRSV